MNASFEQLSTAEKILYVQDLWDHIADEVAESPVTEPEKRELDRRLAAHRADPGSSVPWEQIKAEMRRR